MLGLHGYYDATTARGAGHIRPRAFGRASKQSARSYEAIDNAKLNQEAKDNFGFINAIAAGLLALALIALFVSGFIIDDTSAILASQRLPRTRAPPHSEGRPARRVRVLMFVEALVVGVSASIVGIGAGVLIELGTGRSCPRSAAGSPAPSC